MREFGGRITVQELSCEPVDGRERVTPKGLGRRYIGLQAACKATGFSYYQLRRRVSLLSKTFPDGVRRGPRNAVVLDTRVVEALRRMRELEENGVNMREALEAVAKEDSVAEVPAREAQPEARARGIPWATWVAWGAVAGLAAAALALAVRK